MRLVGAPGAVAGDTGVPVVVAEAVLVPDVATVFRATVYVVPFVKPLIVTGLVVCAGLNGVNVTPPSMEYS
jgi:hypothetical protein